MLTPLQICPFPVGFPIIQDHSKEREELERVESDWALAEALGAGLAAYIALQRAPEAAAVAVVSAVSKFKRRAIKNRINDPAKPNWQVPVKPVPPPFAGKDLDFLNALDGAGEFVELVGLSASSLNASTLAFERALGALEAAEDDPFTRVTGAERIQQWHELGVESADYLARAHAPSAALSSSVQAAIADAYAMFGTEMPKVRPEHALPTDLLAHLYTARIPFGDLERPLTRRPSPLAVTDKSLSRLAVLPDTVTMTAHAVADSSLYPALAETPVKRLLG